jgi:nicotinamide-nucleotide amidase
MTEDQRKTPETIRTAEIVSIGSEMLLGELVDTNSAWLSRQLAAMGISIYRHTTVGDNRERIVSTLQEATTRADLVLTTGGLGPTSDDLTMECLAQAAGEELVEFTEAREHVDRAFARIGYTTPPASNYKQALFPASATLIRNPLGTAMGALVELNGALVATFPGVPQEMKVMFEEEIRPVVRERSVGGVILSRTLWFVGLGESALAERVQDLLDMSDPTVAPLAGQGRVRLRITARAETEKVARARIEPVEQEILARLGKYYFGADDDTLESVLGRMLVERGATLAVAESCTGGLLAKRLTDVPGSSAYFTQGIVTYSNESKERLLGVPREALAEHGAVSEPVARAMAEGVRKVSGADYGLSVTGVAGPDGGTEEKPVGLVWLGLASAEGVVTERLDLSAWRRSRSAIRERSANRAFDFLRRHMSQQYEQN